MKMRVEMQSAKADAKAAWRAEVRESIGAAVTCALCPDITPERGVELLMQAGGGVTFRGTKTAMAKGQALAGDGAWQANMLAWITAYRTLHGHGPTWGEVRREPSLWPESASSGARRAAMSALAATDLLDGTRVPFGLKVRGS
jgi:hypothetical protein